MMKLFTITNTKSLTQFQLQLSNLDSLLVLKNYTRAQKPKHKKRNHQKNQ